MQDLVIIDIFNLLIGPITGLITAIITWLFSSKNQKIALNAQKEQFEKQRKADIKKWEKQKSEERKKLICGSLITNKFIDLKDLYGINYDIYTNLSNYVGHYKKLDFFEKKLMDEQSEKIKQLNKDNVSNLYNKAKPIVEDFIVKMNLSKIWFDEEEFNRIEDCSKIYNEVIEYMISEVNEILKTVASLDGRTIVMPSKEKFNDAYTTIQKILYKKLEIEKLNDFLQL